MTAETIERAVTAPPMLTRAEARDRIAAAAAARDEGMAFAEMAEDARGGWYRALVDQAIVWFALTGEPFSANTFRDLLPDDGPWRGLMGSRFTHAHKNLGIIRCVGGEASTLENTHLKDIGKWRGVDDIAERLEALGIRVDAPSPLRSSSSADAGRPRYVEFLAAKSQRVPHIGPAVSAGDVHSFLHPWQRALVAWAVGRGRAALWADTGLGKTVMQLEWARLSGDRVLVVAPLAVCAQTVREAQRVDLDARYLRQDDGGSGVVVTNYEMTERFDASTFDAVVLDESSILKDVTSKTRDRLIEQFAVTPRRLACTATPAPNDAAELANHAEFLGVATRREMLSTYFVHDQDGWRPKGHARAPMYEWMSQWAAAIRKPSDLGYPDGGYDLPDLRIIDHFVDVDVDPDEADHPSKDRPMFAYGLGGVGDRARVRRQTLEGRCATVADLVDAEPGEPWVLWCGLNAEADLLTELIPGSVNVRGSDHPQAKADAMLDFADGNTRVLITKPSIAAFGLNWQHCARIAFVGLSDSYESYYQSIRRCWRYGQTRPVDAHIVLSRAESQIATNVRRKEAQARQFTAELVNLA